MLIRKKFSLQEVFKWTKKEIFIFFIFTFIICLLYKTFNLTFLRIPWTPIALIGTAVAFIIGFQNNSAYGRIWEARKIWGGIVNESRSWGMMVQSYINNQYTTNPLDDEDIKEIQRELIYRHIAWNNALRHAMRTHKPWEISSVKHTKATDYTDKTIYVPEYETSLRDDLKGYISEKELEYVLAKGNKSTALLYLQSKHLNRLKERGLIWEFSYLELQNLLKEFFSLKGKSERIKNFPYPRQYFTISLYFVWIFLLFLPFGLIPEFSKIGQNFEELYPWIGRHFVWLSVPFNTLISWVFSTMLRIGIAGENPFEGSPLDVPISHISRAIEIDLREMLDENPNQIPKQFPVKKSIEM